MTEDEYVILMGQKSYDSFNKALKEEFDKEQKRTEDKAGKNGTRFQIKLEKSCWEPEVGQELGQGVQVHPDTCNTRITQYPLTPAESIPSCGQRYERDNQNQD